MAKSVEKYRRNAPNITILSGLTSKDRIITERLCHFWPQALLLLLTMSLTPTDIQRLAQLSRLSFDLPASQRLLEGLNNFFDIVEQMRQVDTSGVVPMAHPIDAMPDFAAYAAFAPSASEGMALRLREDVVSEPNQREANQRSAPAVERGLFLVPKVIE
jgi:aspartyl-tRNA(Asn)/glutamyl-tRNA(Gln) amidotransferase subunit C